jgi:ATP-dependent RNA helicase RhlE
MSFNHLGLSPELLRAVAHEGYTEPTPVQTQAIPFVLGGRDLLAGAQTGTGKTAAFVLPMIQRLHASRPSGPRVIRALILTPTRELALQVEESVRTYGAQQPIRSTTIYGGVGFDPQVRALRAGPEIVVATPGRLLDHIGQRTIDLSRVEILVLDEADRMLDMGFIRDIRKILAILPAARQNLLFSATFSDEIRRLADGLLHDPAFVQVTPRNTATELVTQVVHPVDRERKRELLSHLIKSGRIDQALVFTRTKHGANRLALQLEKDGIAATAIHGNKSQPQRVRALADFKAGRFAVLVATEVAARGLDIEALPHVVNFELPMVPEDYVHRIGRTGRAGVDGDAVSLVCVDEAKLLRDIESVLRHPIPVEVIEGFEPDPRIRPEPILRGGLGSGRPAPRVGVGVGGHRAPAVPGLGRPNYPARDRRPAGARSSVPAAAPWTADRPQQAARPQRSGSSRGGYAAPRRPGQGIGNGGPGRPGQGIGNGSRPGPRASESRSGNDGRPSYGEGRSQQRPDHGSQGHADSRAGRDGDRGRPRTDRAGSGTDRRLDRPAMDGQPRRNGTTAHTPRTSGHGMVMPGERLARNGARADR